MLAVVLAAVLSYLSYAFRAAHGGAARHQGRALVETAAKAAILPGALGVVVGAFNGLWCGVAAGVLGYLLRLGVVAEYRTGARSAVTGHRTGRPAVAFGPRVVDTVGIVALSLSLVVLPVLPVLSVVAALDGRSWTSVLMCDVDTGAGPQRARLVELDRQAAGVVGWDVPAHEVVSGTNCSVDPDDVLRDPWWRR
ncbi:hypothetical protein ABZW03_35940 [Kitasatospora sp. NPDC004799]|uniref:hypothetical protein n=1 Tax=Kitasatospora sp. NPDC004799 TaxID=3154460 RepID=UPI0033BEA422